MYKLVCLDLMAFVFIPRIIAVLLILHQAEVHTVHLIFSIWYRVEIRATV